MTGADGDPISTIPTMPGEVVVGSAGWDAARDAIAKANGEHEGKGPSS